MCPQQHIEEPELSLAAWKLRERLAGMCLLSATRHLTLMLKLEQASTGQVGKQKYQST